MIEVIGQYTSAKIFTENIEQEALSQIYEVCSHPIFNNSSVRIMPDCLTEDTEVLTKTGYKLISQLTYTDSIANYDPGTSKVHFRTPKDIIVREVKKDEDIYSYTKGKEMTLIHFGVDFDEILYESDTFLIGVCSNVKRYFTKDNAFNRRKEYRSTGLVELDSCIVQVGMLNLIDELIKKAV